MMINNYCVEISMIMVTKLTRFGELIIKGKEVPQLHRGGEKGKFIRVCWAL